MILVLITCGLFALVGLASQRYGPTQHAVVFVVAAALIAVQFVAARFL